MPNTSGSARKNASDHNTSATSNTSGASASASGNNNSNSNNNSTERRARKRKRCEVVQVTDSDLESELEDCNLKDALAIERKLRHVAKKNSLSDDEMRMLLQKFVKNDHVLALVTLKAEDELAREKRDAEQRAIIITDTPSVLKLTRAKARELNKTPAITLPSLTDAPQPEIAALIKDDLHSDDDDEEYTFKEEDFISDEDPNTTVSDLDSNPRTPQTPLTQTEYEDSPVKFTPDGCFKIPLDKSQRGGQEDLLIATRTRSKLCLQQTTIEDIQSEFVPPDVEQFDALDTEMACTDEDWMEFLNEFSKPLNNSFVGDDDDPINDPEYIAAEKIPVDAEELRDVNISKKELTELVAELFEGLLTEGGSLESIDLDTPHKFLSSNTDRLHTPPTSPEKDASTTDGRAATAASGAQVTRQIDFDFGGGKPTVQCTLTSSTANTSQVQEYSFHPDVMSTPSTNATRGVAVDSPAAPISHATATNESFNSPCKAISLPVTALNSGYATYPQLIAVPVLGQPNCFQLAAVIASADGQAHSIQFPMAVNSVAAATSTVAAPTTEVVRPKNARYSKPYDTNFSWEYISIKKHVYSEYIDKFEKLRHLPLTGVEEERADLSRSADAHGFTQHQYDLLQQQLRIHVQMVTQTFLQTYSHPDYWKLAPKARKLLDELKEKAAEHAPFNAWNLQGAVDLVTKWEADLSEDTQENREMMQFINREIQLTNRNTRQIPRFTPRIMELMLNSTVFMYPQYLPRIPFTPKICSYQAFAPSEAHLIAFGLEKHLQRIRDGEQPISKKALPLPAAVERLSMDTVSGKSKRRIWDHIKTLRKEEHYNPVKFFFEHNRAPPIENELHIFANNTVLPPKDRFDELPIAFQKYLQSHRRTWIARTGTENKKVAIPRLKPPAKAHQSYVEFVREAVGEDIQLPESFIEAAQPSGSATGQIAAAKTPTTSRQSHEVQVKRRRKDHAPTSLVVNINYVFGGVPNVGPVAYSSPNSSQNNISPNASNSGWPEQQKDVSVTTATAPQVPAVTYAYDYQTQTVQPVLGAHDAAAVACNDATQRKLTDFYALSERTPTHSISWEDLSGKQLQLQQQKKRRQQRRVQYSKLRKRLKHFTSCRIGRRHRIAGLKYRQRRLLQQRCDELLTAYYCQLQEAHQRYSEAVCVQRYYRRFKSLEQYTDLLIDLKMFCRTAVTNAPAGLQSGGPAATAAAGISPASASNSPNSLGKRTRSAVGTATASMQQQQPAVEEDGATATARTSKKANRQEENFRHMLLPDSAEDANRKDAIYAFNFYEKVEEAFKASNRADDCRKFNYILKSFDPKRDKVADLYHKLEQLFLPDHPELAQVFLTFLLPPEAAEIGKFFEHFMITNMATFINKLNVYFNKQPAQIRKIYNCLNELAEDRDVTMKKVEAKILPLLKGNQFLIDWFMQQFPEEAPPERLMPPPEHINLKEVQNNQTGEFMEHVSVPLDSPTSEQQQACQLRYINGRIFYGSKMTLPAKLSFMAGTYQESSMEGADADVGLSSCIHGIREHGEQHLAAEAAAATRDNVGNIDDGERGSEEDDATKSLMIDTTAGEEDTSSSVETCDDATLRAHAVRLNPSCYSTSCFTSVTGTPSAAASHAAHPHGKKSALNFSDEPTKTSPRKLAATTTVQPQQPALPPPQLQPQSSSSLSNSPNPLITSPTCTIYTINDTSSSSSSSCAQFRRRSPTKKAKSPNCSAAARQAPLPRLNMQPMVVIHEQNAAIACAKKLQSLIEEEEETENEADSKERIAIVARSKNTMRAGAGASGDLDACHPHLVAKIENTDDWEFLPADAEVSMASFSSIKMDVDSSGEQPRAEPPPAKQRGGAAFAVTADSDEDCKLDIVASLATSPSPPAAKDQSVRTSEAAPAASETCEATVAQQPVWTRDEDKVILIEMKLGSRNRDDLFKRIHSKLPTRSLPEIRSRHQFLMDFLSKLQGK